MVTRAKGALSACGALLALVAPVCVSRPAAAAPPSDAEVSLGAQADTAGDAATARAAGDRAMRAKRYGAAARHFQRAAALDPANGETLVLLGLARYELGQHAAARGALEKALHHELSQEDEELARSYLTLLDATGDSAWSGYSHASLGGGYDTNVDQAPVAGTEQVGAAHGARGGAFGSASLGLAVTRALGAWGSSEIGYSFYDLAYVDPAFDGQSFQEHGLEWQNEAWIARRVRIRIPVRGDLSFTGMRTGMTPFQWSTAVAPEIALRLGTGSKLRLGGALTRRRSFDRTLAMLDGTRSEVSLVQDLSLASWSLAIGGRLRVDALGATRGSMGALGEEAPCGGCRGSYVVPHGYRATILLARVGAPYDWLLRPGASVRLEDRDYTSASYVEGAREDGTIMRWARRVRNDVRVTAAASLALRLGQSWQLAAEYEHVTNRSNFSGRAECTDGGPACHPLDDDDKSYRKHTFGLALEAHWM